MHILTAASRKDKTTDLAFLSLVERFLKSFRGGWVLLSNYDIDIMVEMCHFSKAKNRNKRKNNGSLNNIQFLLSSFTLLKIIYPGLYMHMVNRWMMNVWLIISAGNHTVYLTCEGKFWNLLSHRLTKGKKKRKKKENIRQGRGRLSVDHLSFKCKFEILKSILMIPNHSETLSLHILSHSAAVSETSMSRSHWNWVWLFGIRD